MESNSEVAVFGGGCFWCTEAVFLEIKGVTSVASGYSGGHVADPNYHQVCDETTGHAEVVRIEFDSGQITFSELLEVFFATHDPTTLNRQGADQGYRYRSVVLHTSDAQRDQTAEYIKELGASGDMPGPVVTQIAGFEAFYEAEPEHRQFYANNGASMYCQVVISPKVAKVRQKFAKSLRT
jgi:peptide-methionine (S)-S-oxide reductase